MKRLILLAVVVAIGLALGIRFGITPASARNSYCPGAQTAIYYGRDHAWNNWYGNAGDGNPVDFYDSITTGNSQWCVVIVGTVRDGQNGVIGPFADGSGLNTRYNDDTIYQFRWGPNQGYCADKGTFNTGPEDGEVRIQACIEGGDKSRQEWVYSRSRYFANVYANNTAYEGGPQYIPQLVGDAYHAGSDANGQPISDDYDYQLQWNCAACGRQ